MKKIRSITNQVISGMLMAFSIAMLTSCGGGGDGKVKFASTKLPLPLGRYIQLSHPYATYTLTEPDGNGNGEMIVDFDFEILRHVPDMEYLSFKVEPVKWVDGEWNIRVKFKKDQQAVEQLANVIADENIDRAMISFHRQYEDKTAKELDAIRDRWNGTEVQFDNSAIYIEVPASRIHLTGEGSKSVQVMRSSTIYLYSNNNSSIYVEYSVEAISLLEYARTVACTIKTQDGSFEAVLMGTSNMNGYCRFGSEENNKYYISPRDMDKLLSSPVDVYIDVK